MEDIAYILTRILISRSLSIAVSLDKRFLIDFAIKRFGLTGAQVEELINEDATRDEFGLLIIESIEFV